MLSTFKRSPSALFCTASPVARYKFLNLFKTLIKRGGTKEKEGRSFERLLSFYLFPFLFSSFWSKFKNLFVFKCLNLFVFFGKVSNCLKFLIQM